MKKLTAGIFATLLAVVSADGAYAAIASKGYVDDKVGEVSQTVTTLSGTVSGHTTQIAAKADSSTVTALAGRVDTAEGEIDTLQSTVASKADKATTLAGYGITDAYTSAQGNALAARVSAVEAPKAQVAANVTGPVSGGTVYTAIQNVSGNVGTVTSDVDGLKEDMTQAQTDISDLQEASATHATKEELAAKQDKLSQTGSASQPVYVNAEGKVTAGNTIPTVTTSITTGQTGAAQAGAVADALADKANTADLGALAKLNAVASAQITDGAVATADIANKAVTKEKLADDIVTSLGKADNALQQGSLDGYLTKTAADAAYAGKTLETQVGTVSKENMGTTTATTVVAGVKEAIDAAKAADGKAVAAQADVDALEETVSEQGTRLTTAEGEIDTIQTTISKMATSEAVTSLTNRVTTAEGDITALETAVNDAESGLAATNTIADSALSTAQSAQTTANAALPKATYNSEVGTVSATNMGTSASTVVTAIKEVAGEASAAQTTATAAQKTANAAIPAPTAACAEPENKCVLVSSGAGNYSWEVIARNGEGQ